MPVSNVFQYAVPAPFNATLSNGEFALGVSSPITAATGRTQFFLSRWFDFEGGYYTLRIAADDAVSVYESVSRNNSKLLASVVIDEGVVDLAVYIPRGRRRLDLTLTNISPTASRCFVAFSLWLNAKPVYLSSAEGWKFDTATISDADLAAPVDERLTYPVFSLLPDWATEVTERIGYGTEILQSETDTEQRYSTRRYPTRTIEASFTEWGLRRAFLSNFIGGSLNRKVLVPLWFEQVRLQADLGLTLNMPAGMLVMREFSAGDLVIVMERDPTAYEVLRIQSVNLNANTITFVSAPQSTWGRGCRLIPLRVAIATESVTLDNLTDRAGRGAIRFEIQEPFKFPVPSWNYCVPFWRFKPNLASGVQVSTEQVVYRIDTASSFSEVTDVGQRTRLLTRMGLTFTSRADLYRFRQFAAQAKGRLTRFWFPSRTADIFPLGDISGEYMDARESGAVEFLRTMQETRVMVAVTFKDGRSPYFRRVTDIQPLVFGERYYFDRPIAPAALADIERVSFVHPVRFEQDVFEIKHLVDDSRGAQIGVVVRSTDSGTLPDIECSLTSRPYPLYFEDELSPSISIIGGALNDFVVPADAVDPAVSVLSGDLRNIVIAYNNYAAESVDPSIALVSGDLRVTLLQYTNGLAESLDPSINIVSGDLRIGLINYTNGLAESVDPSVTIVGGSLS